MNDSISNHQNMTVRELRDQLGRRVDKAFFGSESTIITKNGEARAVLIPIAELDRLRRHLAQHHWNTMGALPEDCELCAYADRRAEAALVPVTVAESSDPTPNTNPDPTDKESK